MLVCKNVAVKRGAFLLDGAGQATTVIKCHTWPAGGTVLTTGMLFSPVTSQ